MSLTILEPDESSSDLSEYTVFQIKKNIFWFDNKSTQVLTNQFGFSWDNQWNLIFSLNSQKILVNIVSNDR